MTITRVWIEDGCISCGLSEGTCPQVFKLSDNTSNTVIEGADLSSYEAKIKEAAENCPVGVIMYEDVSLGEGEVSG
jgi:ferredoxin